MNTSKTLWQAVGLMAIGMMFLPIGDGVAKHIQAVSAYPPSMIAWSRFTLGAAIVLPWVLITRQMPCPSRKHARFWFQQCLRGALIATVVFLIITAVGLSPIADVFGAFFIGPGISVILAQLVLRIKPTGMDWVAVALGFVGVLLVVQPTGTMSPGIPWALASGVGYGAFLVATRWAANSGPSIAQLAAQFLIASLCLAPFGIPTLVSHGLLVPGWLLASALFSLVANLFSIIAFAQVGNAVLAPVVYLQVVSAAVVGVLAFNEIPNQLTAIGLCLIIATGAFQALSRR